MTVVSFIQRIHVFTYELYMYRIHEWLIFTYQMLVFRKPTGVTPIFSFHVMDFCSTLRIIGPSKLAIWRTLLPLRHTGSSTLPLEGPLDP